MRSALTLVLGTLLAAAAPGLRAQAKPAAPGAKPTPSAAKPASAQAPKTASQATKPAARPAARRAARPTAKSTPKPAAKPAPKPVETAATPPVPAAAEEKVARRDPFESLVSRQEAQARNDKNLPPGKAGLQVSTLRLDGVVKAPNGMIAVVSNPQQRTYFLREGDQLYDGRVEKIAMDGVSFHEMGKDAFGKPVERQVNKRIYSATPGDAQ